VTALLDTSVVIASLDADELRHAACDRLLSAGGHWLYAHALDESFAILTGGRMGRRLGPAAAASLIEDSVLPFVQLIHLSGREVMRVLADAEHRGARGDAIYDLLHLQAARKAGADALVTLDVRDFEALRRPGDPRVEQP
jgi:predicted nucleic acid-binding protein